MDKRILELALEALEARKAKIVVEIGELQAELKRSHGSEGKKQSPSERMKAYWARKRAESEKSVGVAASGHSRGPQSAEARKAVSERMKAYWEKRKAADKKTA